MRNKIIARLLRSPLHRLLGRHTMLVSVTGRKTGKIHDVPVNYVRENGLLWVTSMRDRTWWRNLHGGAAVEVVTSGKPKCGRGEAIVEEGAVAEGLRAFLDEVPHFAKYYGVALGPDGHPLADDCARAAQERVMVRIDLTPG